MAGCWQIIAHVWHRESGRVYLPLGTLLVLSVLLSLLFSFLNRK
ncbi:MAG: DUF2905 family protein [Candidatus Eisenbacteria bacterium]|uniref:DUF2905 family protein n=1 Tax=Eiseniibacteriota bacterium TaxID=2212470 RepID=A0A538SAD8_UNCEI|nr:MAG: DUF2905 family protein [Candidatus Eisenbacteria bacterium]